jgi:hypothetical protein
LAYESCVYLCFVRILLKEYIYVMEVCLLLLEEKSPTALYCVYGDAVTSPLTAALLNATAGRPWQALVPARSSTCLRVCVGSPDYEPVCQNAKQRRRFVGSCRHLGHRPAAGRCSRTLALSYSNVHIVLLSRQGRRVCMLPFLLGPNFPSHVLIFLELSFSSM